MSGIILWPEGAPLAQGETSEDCPSIQPFILSSVKPTAVMIVCAGGGYSMRADHEGEPVAHWMNKLGISAVVLNYRVAPYQYPCSLLDAQRAIRYIRSRAVEWNINPEQIGILGFSAGGHLAATAGTHWDLGNTRSSDPIDHESCRPDAMVLCYPVITFGKFRHHGSMVNLIGENAAADLKELLSNETQVTSQTPPAFLWHTANDEAVPVANCLLFAEALSEHKVPFEMHIFEDGPHGMALAESSEHVGLWTKQCEYWLRKLWNLS